MIRQFDVLIVGAGPAGMRTAIDARALGLSVLVVDEQPAPGGQIWRAVETVAPTKLGSLLGEEYCSGNSVAKKFRECGAVYEAETQVWQIEPGWKVMLKCSGRAEAVQATQVVLAIGAQERPAPFSGWTLPGVLPVGAAQILLKTSHQVPTDPIWIAGSGPLPLLYMTQLLRAGGKIAGWLDTSPSAAWRRALPWTLAAIKSWPEVAKGLEWIREIKRAGVPRIRGVISFRAIGQNRLQELEYTQRDGSTTRVTANVLLNHEGVVPSVHMTLALGCSHSWNAQQHCMTPDVDEWGQSSIPGVFVAGDGAGIGGGKAAGVRGSLVALGLGLAAGKLNLNTAEKRALPLRKTLKDLLRLRPMLDALYPPRPDITQPEDDTIVCRCEELTAGDVRRAASVAAPGPNQIKAFTRAGMGPCQGRQCGYTIAHIVASTQQKHVSEVGFYRIRPPLKPITLGELASLEIKE